MIWMNQLCLGSAQLCVAQPHCQMTAQARVFVFSTRLNHGISGRDKS